MHKERREESKKYHNIMIPLYADFAPDRLMEFLRTSDNYSIQHARDVVESKGLVR